MFFFLSPFHLFCSCFLARLVRGRGRGLMFACRYGLDETVTEGYQQDIWEYGY